MSAPRAVLKWDVPVDDQAHPIGVGTVALVACQHDPGVVQVWTDEAATDEAKRRVARVYGTGQTVPEGAVHLGSVVTAVGLVWHVFASAFLDGTAERVDR